MNCASELSKKHHFSWVTRNPHQAFAHNAVKPGEHVFVQTYLWRWLVRRSSSVLFFSGSLCTRAWMALTLYFWSSYSKDGTKERRRMSQDDSNAEEISQQFHLKYLKWLKWIIQTDILLKAKGLGCQMLILVSSINSGEACRDYSSHILLSHAWRTDNVETSDVGRWKMTLLGCRSRNTDRPACIISNSHCSASLCRQRH